VRRLVENLPIPREQKEAVLGLNVLKLLKLPVPTRQTASATLSRRSGAVGKLSKAARR